MKYSEALINKLGYKTESENMKELIARVLNAFCQHQELRGLVVQQGGSKALIPIALKCTEKGERAAAQALSRIAITQDPAIAFPGLPAPGDKPHGWVVCQS